MSWRHRDILEAELHEPKGFTTANNGDSIWRNENGLGEWTDREVLPAALNFVDASVAPPTTASGDIYVLSLGASIHANWGTVALKDWVRYDGTSWNVITPSKSILCYDKTLDVLMSYDGSVWATVGSDTNIATNDLTQTDLNRIYTRSPISGVSRLRFQGTSQVLTLEDSANLEMYNGKYNDAGAVPLITLDNNKLSFNGGGCVVQGIGAEMFIYGQFATTNQTKIQLGADLKINSKTARTTIINANKFRWANSDDNTGYGQILNGVFIWGGGVGSTATAIGSEGFSVQKDMLVKGSDTSVSTTGFKVTNSANTSLLEVKNNGVINASNLPTSSAGLSSGDVWNNSGVLNIV